jgi:hypothetical protein
MSTNLLFITVPEADQKLIDLVLTQLRHWDLESGDRFKIVTTRNAYDLRSAPGAAGKDDTDTTSEVNNNNNAWAGAALEDVEAFCLDLARDQENNDDENENENMNYGTSMYVVVDSTGAQTDSCILVHRAHDPEAEGFAWLDRFDKMRIPWDKLSTPWNNLSIANMDFEEFTREFDDGRNREGEDGWFTFMDLEGDD